MFQIPSKPIASQDFPILAFEDCLAKTRKLTDGISGKGCSVYQHLVAVCMVLRLLRQHFSGTPLAERMPPVLDWLCALHDFGKMTPLFQQQIHGALGLDLFLGQGMNHIREDHAQCSQLLLEEKFGDVFARLAGAHHGTGFRMLSYRKAHCDWLGGSQWDALRQELLKKLQSQLELPPYDATEITRGNEAVLLGATILADWIGSGMELPPEVEPDRELVISAVRRAGFIPFQVLTGLDFQTIFNFVPNPLQTLMVEHIVPGGTYVIESEMGSGKTEAALYFGYRLLEKKQISGIYFALPTRLTSEKIHERFNAFLRKILPADASREALLVHGDAWLDWDLFMETEDGRWRYKPDSWFYSAKRALLAPFAVGTVDQALLAVINVRHRDLRAFGLAGKLVVIDEVHSYDNYTGKLVQELVSHLRDWGATVLILSATLTCRARRELLRTSEADPSPKYPLVAIAESGRQLTELQFSGGSRREVLLRHSTDEAACLDDALTRAAVGQQVLWIENTVDQAQKIYRQIETVAPKAIEVGLLHSRYPVCERARKESYWVGLYGKNGSAARREHGRILIGTPLLEQSIDIDGDCLFSRLAPSDMLLQRIGRLWRHGATLPRPPGTVCEAIILHHEIYDFERDLFHDRKADLPYERYVLCRTQEVWLPLNRITLPDDIRPILESTYAERSERGSLQRLKDELERKRDELTRRALRAASMGLNTVDDELACTRINDEPQVEVLLLRKHNGGSDLSHELRTPFAERPIVLPPPEALSTELKNTLKQLKSQMIRVPESLAPDYAAFPLDTLLEHIIYLGNGDIRPVRAAFRDDSGTLLDRVGRPLEGKYSFSYQPSTGYTREER